MTLCLVTDRRRLAGRDAPFDRARARLVAQAREAAEAGVDLVQVRERDLPAADLAALVRDVVAAVCGTQTRVLVNERLDVAIACGAHGVQLRGDSMAPADARRLAPPGFAIGRSVHSVGEVTAAAGADFLIAGTVFPSASKEESTVWLGLDGLAAIVRAAPMPVLAIGGVTASHMDQIARTGAAGCAAIGLFIDASLAAVVSCARRRFDDNENR